MNYEIKSLEEFDFLFSVKPDLLVWFDSSKDKLDEFYLPWNPNLQIDITRSHFIDINPISKGLKLYACNLSYHDIIRLESR